MTVVSAVLAGIFGLTWTAALLSLVKLYRSPENTFLFFFAGVLVALGVNATITLFGSPSAGYSLTINLLSVVTGFLKICFFLSVIHATGDWRSRILVQAVPFGLTVLVATVAWLAAPDDLRVNLPGEAAATHVCGFAFSVTIVAYLSYVSVRTVGWVAHLLPQARHVAFRVGLGCIGVGALAHLTTACFSLNASVARFFGVQILPIPLTMPKALLFVTIAGFAGLILGVLIPFFDGLVREIPVIARQRAAAQALTPLWSALDAAFPELRLTLTGAGAGRRLYRRMVEISDGLILLRPYYSARVADLAEAESCRAGEDDESRRISVHAAMIVAALAAHERGEVATDPHPPMSLATDDDSRAAETDLLVRLARRFAQLRTPTAPSVH